MNTQLEQFAQRINSYLQSEAQNTEGPGWPQWIPETIQKNGWEEMDGADVCRDKTHKITTNQEMTRAYVVAVEDDDRTSENPQHTPASWATSYDGHGGMTVTGSDGQQVGFVSQNQRQKLNARLIAAAPGVADTIRQQRETIAQLVEVLKELEKAATESTANLVAFDGAERLDKAIDEARAAINRQAEGRVK